mgnify:CR=1 FL=1
MAKKAITVARVSREKIITGNDHILITKEAIKRVDSALRVIKVVQGRGSRSESK